MLKFFFGRNTISNTSEDYSQPPAVWLRDPLQHPDLKRMEQRELADLPFPGWPWPRATADETCDCR